MQAIDHMLGMILKTPFGKFIRRISIERIRRLTMFTLVILSAGLIFVTTAMHMQASSDSFGQLPFNLHSYLRADYSVDSFPNRLAAVNFDLVLDYLNDKFYGDAPERFGTAIGGLESPVPTVTPSYPWGFTQTLSPTTTLYPSETSSRTPFPPRTSTATPSKPPSHYLTLTPTWKPTSTPTLRPTVKPTETPKPTKPEPTETPPTKQPPTKPPPTDPYPPPPPPPPPPPYP